MTGAHHERPPLPPLIHEAATPRISRGTIAILEEDFKLLFTWR